MTEPVATSSMDFIGLLIAAGLIFVALMTIGLIFARLYRRSSKEVSFVRTGFGGQKVIVNGGALVLPVLHETIPVNMNTLRLEVRRANEQALINKDRMRVDVQAEFYVRVQPTVESIANAAQTLGRRTMEPTALKELVEGKFVDSLRAVAAEMAMEELHEQRVSFVQKVQAAVSEDILKNGLELESVSLTGLDQTNKEYFNPDNAFDAEGLTKLTQEIEERRKKRNDIEQETEVLIQRKNLDAEQQRLEISRDQEYARLQQEREVEIRKADQVAQIASERAQREYEAEQAKIEAGRQVKEASIEADRQVAERQIAKDKLIREQEIAKEQAVEAAAVEKAKQVSLAEQGRDIAVAEKSREKSEADATADGARAVAVQAEEAVVTARQTEVAERDKQIELIEARKAAEQQAITIKVAAETEKLAAIDQAEAVRIAAEAEGEKARIAAHAHADAEKAHAEAQEAVYAVEADGKRAVNEAANVLSPEQIAMQIKLELIKALPEIIAESVKPIEAIDGIKIVQVDGLAGAANANGGNGDTAEHGRSAGGSLPDQAVAAALQYRTQAPILDSLLNEVGLDGGSLAGLAKAVAEKPCRTGESNASSPHPNGAGDDGQASA
ncbi:MAG: flotillin domain-containing protein [Hyphomicrobiaceae bacterium]